MLELTEFYSKPCKPCSYYDDRYSHFRYFFIQNCSKAFCQALIERGYRRFGEYFFTPMCAGCSECLSIRQRVGDFVLSKSHRRVIAKNAQTSVFITRPSVSDEKLRLYNQYHQIMEGKKGWNYKEMSADDYCESFVEGFCDFGYEILYEIEGKLVGVGYFDMLENAISATYFFYDHAFAKLSLGTFNILTQLLIAKSKNLPYFYPGYWIKNHHSVGYKERFKPFEILVNTPDIFELPLWKAPESTTPLDSRTSHT